MNIDDIYSQASPDARTQPEFYCYRTEEGTEYLLPLGWDVVTADVLISHAFCKEPIPVKVKFVPEVGVPEILWRAAPAEEKGETRLETDIRAVIRRIAGAMAYGAVKQGVFDTEKDAEVFYHELHHIFSSRIAMPEAALWSFGLDWAYGIEPASLAPAERLSALPESFDPSAAPLSGILISRHDTRPQIMKRVELLAGIQALQHPDARMTVTLPVENVDSLSFISRRRSEETDNAARDLGRRVMQVAADRVMESCDRDALLGFDPAHNSKLRAALHEGRAAGVPEGLLQQAISRARQGFETFDLGAEYNTGGPEFYTVLSVPDDFMETALTGHGFMMVDAGKASYHAAAPELLEKISESIWASGGPRIFFRDTAVSASPFGRDADLATGAAGGFISRADKARHFAPGAAIDIASFSADANALLDTDRLAHTARILTIALTACAGDDQAISIGCVNLSSWLMASGLAYDSDEGRTSAALAVSVISGACHLASAEMADRIGAFDGYAAMSKDYLQAVKQKISALSGSSAAGTGVLRRVQNINTGLCRDKNLVAAAQDLWSRAYHLGREQGFRHIHLTALAADIDLQALMGAASRNITPETTLALLATADNDIYGKRMSAAAVAGLKRLGYKTAEIDDMHSYVVGHGTLLDAPGIDHEALRARGLSEVALQRLDAALKNTRHLRYVFNDWTLGEAVEPLETLGFSEDDIDDANIHACGTLTLEGAPHLKPQHLAVFDCAQPSGPDSVRQVSPEAQVKMQAAVETFLSGAVAHTVLLKHHAGMDEVQGLLLKGWETGVKTLAMYRDASSLMDAMIVPQSQPDDIEDDDAGEGSGRIKAVSA